MRRLVPLLVFLVAACGGGAVPSSTTTSVDALATQPTPTATSTTTTAAVETFEPTALATELDRSILSLGLEPGDIRPGRFRLEPGRSADTLMAVDGRYWVTEQGNVYTALDVDPSLIAEQMALLAAAVESMGGQPVGSPYLASLHEHYRGTEFQLGLTALVRSLALGGLTAEWAEQWSWFMQSDGNEVPDELLACGEAIAALDRAAQSWIWGLDISFVDGRWEFPVAEFEMALAAEIDGAAICELFVEVPGPSPVLVIERVDGGGEIRVLVDDKVYTDREPALILTIVMSPDESVGPPPTRPDPESLFTLRSTYLAAIGVCGELPWIYSNFAAADTYEAPLAGGYLGPVVFASAWYCEDQVPDNRRGDTG